MGNGKFGLGLYDDKFIPGLRELAGAIKNAGGVPAIQLWHAGRQINSSDVFSGYIVAPSQYHALFAMKPQDNWILIR